MISPNDLELDAQTLFAAELQRRLAAGRSVADAARGAREALADTRWAHPFFGLVHVIGDGRTRPFGD